MCLFISGMQRDAKQLLVCLAARGKRSVCVRQVTNQRLEEVVILVPCPVWMEGFGGSKAQNEP